MGFIIQDSSKRAKSSHRFKKKTEKKTPFLWSDSGDGAVWRHSALLNCDFKLLKVSISVELPSLDYFKIPRRRTYTHTHRATMDTHMHSSHTHTPLLPKNYLPFLTSSPRTYGVIAALSDFTQIMSLCSSATPGRMSGWRRGTRRTDGGTSCCISELVTHGN